MRKPLAAIAACSLLATASAVAASSPAAAAGCTAPTIVSSTATPKKVVVGVSQNKGFVLTVKVRQKGCTPSTVQADVYSPTFGNTVDLTRVGRSGDATTWDVGLRISPSGLTNADAGTWISYVYVNGTDASDYGPNIRVVRAARLSTNASPEPVKKGATLTVKGTLTRADWKTLSYRGYAGKDVQLQWRSANGSYSTIKTVTSNAEGDLKTKVKGNRDGCYRYVFKGSSTTDSVKSKGDCIDVR
jgi:hypothetical protein